jgi:hypothetical protein
MEIQHANYLNTMLEKPIFPSFVYAVSHLLRPISTQSTRLSWDNQTPNDRRNLYLATHKCVQEFRTVQHTNPISSGT